MRSYAKDRVKSMGLSGPGKIRVNQSGCLDRCEKAPASWSIPTTSGTPRRRAPREGHDALVRRLAELVGEREEAHARIGAEDLQHARGERGDQQPCGGHQRHPHVALALHLHQHRAAQQERDAREHLVAHAEELPQRVDAAQRIDHALVEEIAPHRDAEPGADEVDLAVGAPSGSSMTGRYKTNAQPPHTG